MSDCNINEIHLKIFPPSATYVKDPSSAYLNSQAESNPRSFLNIDVHEMNQKVINGEEAVESKQKVSFGYFPNISLRRSDDSILHISIGNSSKITKRHKKNSWLVAKLWRFSHKGKSQRRKKSKWFFSPKLNKDDVYRLSSGSLNLMNDEMLISINKQNYSDYRRPSCDTTKHHNEIENKQLKLIGRDLPDVFPKSNGGDCENGANELDCYMNEIKRRERKCFEA